MAPALSGKSWLELPGAPRKEEYVNAVYDGKIRNFSYNYDRDMYTSLWVAYLLYQSVTEGENSANWKNDPNVPDQYEINVSGDFQIVFTNLSPSNSTSNKDRTAIWDVEWSGYSSQN